METARGSIALGSAVRRAFRGEKANRSTRRIPISIASRERRAPPAARRRGRRELGVRLTAAANSADGWAMESPTLGNEPPAPLPVASPTAERALIACGNCSRQHDVTLLAPGARFQCECGEWLTVEARAPRVPRPMVCGHCGGKLEIGAQRCGYCDAEITLEERGLAGVCPLCYARLYKDARYCMECGVAIEAQAVRPITQGVYCPRCQGALDSRSLGTFALVECASCAGLWLAPDVFESICSRADQEALVRQHLASRAAPPVDASAAPPGYLACIECADLMVRKNFGGNSGVIIDVCRGHGVWLDHRELERILDFVHSGGLMRARERDIERLESRAARARDAGDEACVLGASEIACAPRDEPSLIDVMRWIGSKLDGRTPPR